MTSRWASKEKRVMSVATSTAARADHPLSDGFTACPRGGGIIDRPCVGGPGQSARPGVSGGEGLAVGTVAGFDGGSRERRIEACGSAAQRSGAGDRVCGCRAGAGWEAAAGTAAKGGWPEASRSVDPASDPASVAGGSTPTVANGRMAPRRPCCASRWVTPRFRVLPPSAEAAGAGRRLRTRTLRSVPWDE